VHHSRRRAVDHLDDDAGLAYTLSGLCQGHFDDALLAIETLWCWKGL